MLGSKKNSHAAHTVEEAAAAVDYGADFSNWKEGALLEVHARQQTIMTEQIALPFAEPLVLPNTDRIHTRMCSTHFPHFCAKCVTFFFLIFSRASSMYPVIKIVQLVRTFRLGKNEMLQKMN